MNLLKHKVIFLTGGTEGIGFECAKLYANNGASLCIISHSENSIIHAKEKLSSKNIIYAKADVSNTQEIQNAINGTVKKFGKIDVIHNNAGISNPSKSLHDTTEDEWQRIFDVNVKGIYNTTKSGINELIKTRGNILNTSSLVGEIGQEIHAAYAATKGAVNALTKSMALDFAKNKIRVNAVAPAGVWTPMLRTWSEQQPDSKSIDTSVGLLP
jgi:NAD(P)-dependent dehydrogenase (short-subunit alcohol dehydrogenase family)